MRVLVVTHLYLFPDKSIRRGGINIHQSLLNLKESGNEVKVIFFLPLTLSFVRSFKFRFFKFRFEPYCLDGIDVQPIFYLPRFSKVLPEFDAFIKTKLFSIFCFYRLDAVFSQSLFPDGPVARMIAKSLKVPLYSIMRGSDVHTISTNFSNVRRSVQKVLRSSDSVISVSENLKSQSIEVFGKDYVNQILYTTCDVNLFKPQKMPSHQLTKWYFVGALYEPKGIFELLTAFNELILEGYDLELSIFGDGPHRAKFEEKIKVLGLEDRITLFGQVSDREWLLQLINRNDLLVFPSHNEGLPNSVVEAVAAGRGVISSRVGGVAEISPQNSAYKLIEKKEPSQIIMAFKQILESPEEDFLNDLNTNREKVINRFSPKSQQEAFRLIFKEDSQKV